MVLGSRLPDLCWIISWLWFCIENIKSWICHIFQMADPVGIKQNQYELLVYYVLYIAFTLTSPKNLILNFQGQILKFHFLINGCPSWGATWIRKAFFFILFYEVISCYLIVWVMFVSFYVRMIYNSLVLFESSQRLTFHIVLWKCQGNGFLWLELPGLSNQLNLGNVRFQGQAMAGIRLY